MARAAVFLAALATFPTAAAAQTVTVDPATDFQTIRGWEVSDRIWQTDKKADRYDGSWEPLSGPIFDALVDEAGINNLRLQVSSGIENPVGNWQRFVSGEIGYQEMKRHLYEVVNDNDDPLVINPAGFQFFALDQAVSKVLLPMRARLAARGEALYVTLNFVDFAWTDGTTELNLAKHPAEYAEFILACFQHIDRTYGFVPDALEIVLEPENTDGWSGKAIGRAIVAATDRLAAAGYDPDVIAPSSKAAENAVRYFDQLSAVPGAGARVDMLSYHRYGQKTYKSLPRIAAAARAAGIQTGMLEYTKGNIDMLFEDLTVANVSAWQKYGVARKIVDGDERSSASYYLEAHFKGNRLDRIELSPTGLLLAEVFRLFRSGAVRIGASSDSDKVAAVAMRAPDGRHGLALRLKDRAAVTVAGLPAGLYTLSGRTDEGDVVAAQAVTILADQTFTMPETGKGVLTLRPAD